MFNGERSTRMMPNRSDLPGIRGRAAGSRGWLLAAVLALSTAAFSLATAQGNYQEAPDLASLVESGELPPVEERLPEQPRVVEPVDRVGSYGGTWRMGL